MVQLMQARLAVLLLVGCALGCGGSTPTSPSRPGSGGGGNPSPAAPTITCPANIAASTTTTTTQVAFPVPAVSGGLAPVTVTCSPTSGSTFPLGATSVTCSATDSSSRQSTCSFSVNVTRIPTLQRTRFLAFGDSITAGEVTVPTAAATGSSGLPSFRLIVVPAASYPTQLQTLLRTRYITQQTAITVTNAGRSGEMAIQGAARLPAVMSEVRPEAVLLLEGYNDLALLGANGIGVAAAAMNTMAAEARNRGARVFIASLTPPRVGGRSALPADQVSALNARLRTVAAGENAVFVDLYQALVTNVSLYVGLDGLHLTEIGYQKVAETFSTAIQSSLESR